MFTFTLKDIFNFIKGNIKSYFSIYLVIIFYIVFYNCSYFEGLKSELELRGSSPYFMVVEFSWFISIISSILFIKHRNTENGDYGFYRFLVFIILLLLYKLHLTGVTSPIGMLGIFVFMPLLLSFIFLTYRTKFFNIYLILFFSIPISLTIRDRIITTNFLETCDAETPKAEFNPIYLPDEFFHEEVVNGETKLVPNVVVTSIVYDSEIEREKQEFKENYIYIYNNCGYFDYKDRTTIVRSLIKEGYIILCKDGSYYKKELKCSHCSKESYEYTIEKVSLDKKVKRDVLSRAWDLSIYTSSNPSYIKGTWVHCLYNAKEKNEVKFPKIRNTEKDYRNFIKSLSEKITETQGE